MVPNDWLYPGQTLGRKVRTSLLCGRHALRLLLAQSRMRFAWVLWINGQEAESGHAQPLGSVYRNLLILAEPYMGVRKVRSWYLTNQNLDRILNSDEEETPVFSTKPWKLKDWQNKAEKYSMKGPAICSGSLSVSERHGIYCAFMPGICTSWGRSHWPHVHMEHGNTYGISES